MDFVKAVKIGLYVKKFYGAYKTVDGLNKYADKVERQDPGKIDWKELQYIRNSDLAQARKELEDICDRLEAALSKKMTLPEPDGMRAYQDAMKAVDKKGKDSKEAKSAMEAYRRSLYMYDRDMKALVKDIKDQKAEGREFASIAEKVSKATLGCRDAFATLAKVPTFSGTGNNALFLSLSEDCGHIAGLSDLAAKRMDKLIYTIGQSFVEAEDLIAQNQVWLDWALKDALKSDDTLKKNLKSETPRR